MQKPLYFITLIFAPSRRYKDSSEEGRLQTFASSTCLTCSCSGSSFIPRHEADSPCLVSMSVQQTLLWLFQALKHSAPTWGRLDSGFFLVFSLILSSGFNLYTNSDSGYWPLLWPCFCLCFLPNWAFWTSSLTFHLRWCLPAGLNLPHSDLVHKIWLCCLLTEHIF